MPQKNKNKNKNHELPKTSLKNLTFDRQFLCNEVCYGWTTEELGWEKTLILTKEAQNQL